MPAALKDWHQGERALRNKPGFGKEVRISYTHISSYAPEQQGWLGTVNADQERRRYSRLRLRGCGASESRSTRESSWVRRVRYMK